MILSELIAQAQALLAEHGDLEILDCGRHTEVSSISLLEVESDDDFPKDWNMPAGSKFGLINYDY